MQHRQSRTRSPVTPERYRGYLRKQDSHPTLYKDHQPPTTQLGFPPCKIAATPLTKLQIYSTPWPPPPANSGEPPPRRPTSSSSPRALLFLFSLSLTSCLFFFLAATTMATIGGELKLGAHGPGRHGHPRPRSVRIRPPRPLLRRPPAFPSLPEPSPCRPGHRRPPQSRHGSCSPELGHPGNISKSQIFYFVYLFCKAISR